MVMMKGVILAGPSGRMIFVVMPLSVGFYPVQKPSPSTHPPTDDPMNQPLMKSPLL